MKTLLFSRIFYQVQDKKITLSKGLAREVVIASLRNINEKSPFEYSSIIVDLDLNGDIFMNSLKDYELFPRALSNIKDAVFFEKVHQYISSPFMVSNTLILLFVIYYGFYS